MYMYMLIASDDSCVGLITAILSGITTGGLMVGTPICLVRRLSSLCRSN